jgi:uncharacterized repeat protein (TIGR03809 family)
MTDEHPLRRFNKTAEKWRDLAEKRRLYFEELHQSGRWKYYYTETVFYRRLGKAAELVELWEPVLKARLTELPSAPKSPTMSPPAMSAPKSPPMSPPMSPRPVAPPRRRAI